MSYICKAIKSEVTVLYPLYTSFAAHIVEFGLHKSLPLTFHGMPKRSFEEFRDPPRPSKVEDSHPQQRDRINAILNHSKTALFQALKLAKGFERQKLGRRQKTAATEKQLDNIRRLKLEVVELKALDLVKTAERHLYKTLLKNKPIASCGDLPAHVRLPIQEDKTNESVECLNVQARLFNSDVVQKATEVAVQGIRAALGVAKQEAGGKKRLRAKDYAIGLRSDADVASPTSQKEDGDEWEGISSSAHSSRSSQSEPSIDNELSSIDGDDYERYESRLAASSDSSSSYNDSESLKQDHLNSRPHPKSRFSFHTPSLSPSPPPIRYGSSKPSEPSKNNVKSTTFLPTLLATGYYSGSDSDAPSLASDSENNQSTHHHPQRKNRMGQQARRALWEKKFKERANHLQSGNGKRKQLEPGGAGDARDIGWDPRKGAVEGGGDKRMSRRQRREGVNGNFAGSKKPTGANMDPVSDVRTRNSTNANPNAKVSDKQKADGPLHPSWEAARRAKEAKSLAKPMGKKVVF